MPNADSKNKNERQIKQVDTVITLVKLKTTKRRNISPDKIIPIFHANFFGEELTYSGTWPLTIPRPSIREGENLGLINTLIIKSVKKMKITYLIILKSSLNNTSINEINIKRNRMPAAALISRSFNTGTL